MLFDRFRKKQPPKGSGEALEPVDITNEVPEVKDVLAEIDAALKKADDITRDLQRRTSKYLDTSRGCGC